MTRVDQISMAREKIEIIKNLAQKNCCYLYNFSYIKLQLYTF